MPQDPYAQIAKADPYASIAKRGDTGQGGFLSSFAEQSGLKALAHLPTALANLPGGIKAAAQQSVAGAKDAYASYQREGMSNATTEKALHAIPVIGPLGQRLEDQQDAGNYRGMAGTAAGFATGLAAPELAGGAVGRLAGMVPKAGDLANALDSAGGFAQSEGGKIINRAAGTLKDDFKRGANPGRGYLAQGGGAARGMQDLATKAEGIRDATGKALRDAYQTSTTKGTMIPDQELYDTLSGPMQAVTGRTYVPSTLRDAVKSHAAELDGSLGKVAANGGISPVDLHDFKKDLAASINWKDASQETINSVKQQQVGALGGLLEKYVPEVEPLNQSYQDLVKLATRARSRADTGSLPLTSHIHDAAAMAGAAAMGNGAGATVKAAGMAGALAARSVPARTALASGLYKAGDALSGYADTLRDGAGEANQAVDNPVINQSNVPSAWMQLGSAKLTQHMMVLPDSTSKLSADAIEGLGQTPIGQRVLQYASGLKPGTKAMAALAVQAAAESQRQNDQQQPQQATPVGAAQ